MTKQTSDRKGTEKMSNPLAITIHKGIKIRPFLSEVEIRYSLYVNGEPQSFKTREAAERHINRFKN